MTQSTKPQQVTGISYNAPRHIAIGDVFYVIRSTETTHFREPCKVCEDKHELTINGVTFRCPCCGQTNETITIYNYIVQRVRVYSIECKANTDTWKEGEYRSVTFGVYHKEGHGYGDYFSNNFTRDIDSRRFENLNPDVSKTSSDFCDYAIYDDYKKAIAVADALNAAEADKLKEYNAIHGTTYQTEFKRKHDKKSS